MFKGAVSVFFVILLTSKVSFAERWVISTLEWPPYTCAQCPENGAGAKALRDALKTQGIDVEFVFVTWRNAIRNTLEGRSVGFFPAWIEDNSQGQFIVSDALFFSPTGFAYPSSKELRWTHLSDLKGKKIGVAQDYGNTAEFNRLVKQGIIQTETVVSDDTNLRKVAAAKIDGAFIDIINARFLLEKNMPDINSRVIVGSNVVENKSLHLMLNPKTVNTSKQNKLKLATQTVNFQKIVDEYLHKNYPFLFVKK